MKDSNWSSIQCCSSELLPLSPPFRPWPFIWLIISPVILSGALQPVISPCVSLKQQHTSWVVTQHVTEPPCSHSDTGNLTVLRLQLWHKTFIPQRSDSELFISLWVGHVMLTWLVCLIWWIAANSGSDLFTTIDVWMVGVADTGTNLLLLLHWPTHWCFPSLLYFWQILLFKRQLPDVSYHDM